MESGLATHEIEELVCSKLKYSLEITACDKVVPLLISKIENNELHCTASATDNSPLRQSLRDRINERYARGESMWHALSAQENPFVNYTFEELRALMSLDMDSYTNKTKPAASSMKRLSAPSSFDGRVTFKSCEKAVRNQEHCGSCWAFAAAETLTTNLCALGKADTPVLSPQDMVSCDMLNHGCHGGNLALAWFDINHVGIRSDECVPYVSGGGSVPLCDPFACSGKGANTRYSCPHSSKCSEGNADMQDALMKVGALEVGFTVYEDFMHYSGGIYKHSGDGKALGGHAVKIVGWGEQGSTFYWIVQNSWGPTWGESGFFRIVDFKEDPDSNFAAGGGYHCAAPSDSDAGVVV